MALSTRELYLILRARDEASRVLRGLSNNVTHLSRAAQAAAQQNIRHGQAMATMGIAIAGAGAVGVNALNNMTDAAINYNAEAAKTLTQTDKVGATLEQIKDIGKDVAREIPAPFEQMQASLYDVFSSMDVNVEEARSLLKQFAKDSVGGATDIQTAGRAVIEVLNAWQIPVKDVTRVSDVMFQLVRKGVGTYQEFARTIGRAIPSAVAAGQSIEDLAGAMAFLTRRGLSTAMAATSMGRAFDALKNPKSIKNLKDLGVQVLNAKGEFKPLVDIINDMNKATEGMSKPEKTAWLTAAFKGSGGTIQAMRFFNHALNDSDNLLDTLSADMKNAGGQAQAAYDIMKNTPAAKIQELKNKFEVLRTEVGDRLIPVKIALAEAFIKVLDAWSKLSPGMQKLIVYGAAIASVLAIVIGVVVAVAGFFLMLAGGAALAGISLGTVAAVGGIVVAAIAAIGAIIVVVVKYWDQIKAAVVNFASAIWDFLKGAWAGLQVAFEGAKSVFNTVKDAVVNFGKAVWGLIDGPVGELVGRFKDMWDWVKKVADVLWAAASPGLIVAWNGLKDAWNTLKQAFADAWTQIKQAFQDAWAILKPALTDLWNTIKEIWPSIKALGETIWTWLGPAFTMLWQVIKQLWPIFLAVGKAIWTLLKPALAVIGAIIFGVVIGAITALIVIVKFLAATFASAAIFISSVIGPLVKFIASTFAAILTIIKNVIGFVSAVIRGDWAGAWNYAKAIVVSVFNAIGVFLKGAWGVIVGIVKGIYNGVIAWFKNMWNSLVGHSIIPDMVNAIISWFARLAARVVAWVISLWNNVINWFKNSANTIRNNVANFIANVVDRWNNFKNNLIRIARETWDSIVAKIRDAITNVKTKIGDGIQWIKDKFSNSKNWLVQAGKDIIDGLKDGVVNRMQAIGQWLKNRVVDPIVAAVKKHFGIKSPSTVFAGIGNNMIQGLIQGLMKTGSGDIVKKIFGSMPKALSALFDKGLLDLANLPKKALDALGMSAIGDWTGKVGKGVFGAVGGSASKLLHAIRSMFGVGGGTYPGHGERGANKSWDFMIKSKAQGDAIAGFVKKFAKQLGVMYVIWNKHIWNIMRNSEGWRNYTRYGSNASPSQMHTNHVHVSLFKNGGTIDELIYGIGQRSGRGYVFGEAGREYVTPENKVGGKEINQYIQIHTQEINPRKHAADLGWELAVRVG